jgi:hypothetical protein
MHRALPGSEYYDGSVPLAAFGGRRAYPPGHRQADGTKWNEQQAVPTFTDVRSTG